MASENGTIAEDLPGPCRACGAGLGHRDSVGWTCATCGWRCGDVVDAELPQARVDGVCYLGFGDRIKIGTSRNPRARLAQLRFDELLAFERGDRSLEHKRHLQFADARNPGSEWFRSHEELTDHIRLLSRGVGDPWNLYQRWRSELLALHAF